MEKDGLELASEKLIEYVRNNDPAKADEMQASLNERHTKQKQFRKDLVKEHLLKQFIQIILVLLFFGACGIIIFIFTQSLFEGFIALIAFVFLVIFIARR